MIREEFDRLIASVAALPSVRAVGKSDGDALPESNESDIDVFVYCDQIPSGQARLEAVRTMGEAVRDVRISKEAGAHWGHCDYVLLADAEVCLMYFTVGQAADEIEGILRGERLNKERNYFYPTGRCATLLGMHILCDKDGFLASMQRRLSEYPDSLALRLTQHHLELLNDTEDLDRAVQRKDALFYHFALDLALDHFLQALFALNRTFFPSRKRTLQYLASFAIAPADCADRLLRVLALGGTGETVPESYREFVELSKELSILAARNP